VSKVNSFLVKRLKEKLWKTPAPTELSSFAGVFRVTPLSHQEHEQLQTLLNDYKNDELAETETDLRTLSDITSEVKAINNQAAILHGERIHRAQEILKRYRDGAFSAWLMTTYGNRQTPYNFLQYYELQKQLPQTLHSKLDAMPRQAVYTLASRDAPLEKKKEIIETYEGASKNELLLLIRKTFPLDENDRRAEDVAEQIIASLKKAAALVDQKNFSPTAQQKETLQCLITHFTNRLS
jgi:hypothetical protein